MVILHFVDVKAALKSYVSWVHRVEDQSMYEASLLFFIGAVAFASISPTGYLPTFLAGVIFP